MKKINRILSLLLAVFMLACAASPVFAEELLDEERTGSITVTIADEEGPVAGGTLEIIPVATIHLEGPDYVIELTEDFAEAGFDTELLYSQTLAGQIADYAAEHHIAGTMADIGADGKATAENLPVGLYLIVQKTAAEGYVPVNPFLVSVPMKDGDSLVYDVDATPKVGTAATETTEPDEPPPIPPTGQLWWPVPVLAFAGLLCFSVGYFQKRKARENEKG